MKKFVYAVVSFSLLLAVSGCSPEVGSVEWCEDMDKKNKGDWTANEVKAYAENCIFRKGDK